MSEVWKAIPGYEGLYEASNEGRIRSLRDNKGNRRIREIAKGNSTPYKNAALYGADGAKTYYAVHLLVAMTFLGPRPPGLEINHKDGVPKNNRVNNLEYVTRKENTQHGRWVLGRCIGSLNGAAKLNEEKVREIKKKLTAGQSYASLGREYGVNEIQISRIAKGRNWKSVH